MFQACGINDGKGAFIQNGVAFPSVAGYARSVMHQSFFTPRQAVKQSRFSDVRASDQRNYCCHYLNAAKFALCVRKNKVSLMTTGGRVPDSSMSSHPMMVPV